MTAVSPVAERRYKDALERARQDLTAAKARAAEIAAQIEAADLQCRRLGRLILSIANLLGEEPPADVVAFMNLKPTRKPRQLTALDALREGKS